MESGGSAGGKLEVGLTSLPAGHSLSFPLPSRGASSASAPALRAPSFAAALSAPPSALHARLQHFLPALAHANSELSARIASEGAAAVRVEIEEGTAESEQQHIEMHLAVGELPSDDSDSEEERGGGGEGEGGAGGSRGRRPGRPRIELLRSAGGAGAEGSGMGAGEPGVGEEEEEEEEEEDGPPGAGFPEGKWITGKALEKRKDEILRLLAAGKGGRGGRGGSGSSE